MQMSQLRLRPLYSLSPSTQSQVLEIRDSGLVGVRETRNSEIVNQNKGYDMSRTRLNKSRLIKSI